MTDFGLSYAQGQFDSQEPPEGKTVETCSICGRDIFAGEQVCMVDGDMICPDCYTIVQASEDEPPYEQ